MRFPHFTLAAYLAQSSKVLARRRGFFSFGENYQGVEMRDKIGLFHDFRFEAGTP
jgi:hypothetical protein